MTSTVSSYVLDPAWDRERQRLEALTGLYQPTTHRLLEQIGVEPGWHCLDAGAGTGNVAALLSGMVGARGKVVATDLDTRFLDELYQANIEVRRHDIVNDDLEENTYDLVHVRLLLMHLPDRAAVARKLIRALKPGGWLLAEDFDFVTWGAFEPEAPLQLRAKEAIVGLMTGVGVEPQMGRKLPALLEAAGLEEVTAEAFTRVVPRGGRGIEAAALMMEQLRDKLIALELITATEIDGAIAECRMPAEGHWGAAPLMVSVWGRRTA